MPETIDRLLHISHEKAVILSHDRLKKILLNHIAVLVFISKYIFKIISVFLCCGSGLFIFIIEDLKSKMFHVRKIKDILFPLHTIKYLQIP